MSKTLIGIFLETVAANRKPAQFMRHRETGWESISGERARTEVESLALGLRELAIERGDRVAILSETRYEWALADLAILGLGAVTVPIYTTLTPPQCLTLLENSESKLVFLSSREQLDKIRGLFSRLPDLRVVAFDDPGEAADARITSLAAVMAHGTAARAREPEAFATAAARVRPEDLATIIYTSGTTGEPKGAMLTHDNIASNVLSSLQVIDLAPGDTCLSFLPLSHIFERMGGLYAMLAAGATIAYARSLDTVGADALEVRPTVLIGVPRFYEKVVARILHAATEFSPLKRRLFDWGVARGIARARARFAGHERAGLLDRLADRLVASKIRARLGGRMRLCISGGAPLPAQVMEFFFAIGIPVMEGYGLTETSPVICLNAPGEEKPGSVGRPIPGIEVKIADNGEILTRGPHVMKGYYRNEPATREALAGGWFHTGDIGHLDERGRLMITDRLKDLIVTAGGKKVAPQPVENRLRESAWIAEAILIGDQRPFVVCLLVPDFARLEAEARERGWPIGSRDRLLAHPEVHELFQQAVDHVNRDLASFESIKRFALLDRELSQESGEITPTLKVKRRVVSAKFAGLVDPLYRDTRAAAS